MIVEVPSASAASNRARCETDLSPGTDDRPDERAAPADDQRLADHPGGPERGDLPVHR